MIKYGEGVEVMGVGCKGERGGVDWVGVSRGGGGGRFRGGINKGEGSQVYLNFVWGRSGLKYVCWSWGSRGCPHAAILIFLSGFF